MKYSCHICGHDNPLSVEKHHIVPRRFGGSDRKENIVTLCANCHTAVEQIYNDRFFARVGVETAGDISAQWERKRDKAIRYLYKNTEVLQQELAEAFDVADATVNHIIDDGDRDGLE